MSQPASTRHIVKASIPVGRGTAKDDEYTDHQFEDDVAAAMPTLEKMAAEALAELKAGNGRKFPE